MPVPAPGGFAVLLVPNGDALVAVPLPKVLPAPAAPDPQNPAEPVLLAPMYLRVSSSRSNPQMQVFGQSIVAGQITLFRVSLAPNPPVVCGCWPNVEVPDVDPNPPPNPDVVGVVVAVLDCPNKFEVPAGFPNNPPELWFDPNVLPVI